MAGIKRLFITVTLVHLVCEFVRCSDGEEMLSMSRKLDEMLGEKNQRPSKESEWPSEIPKFYNSGSEEGYREELSIVNITNTVDKNLFSDANHYKFFTRAGVSYLAASTPAMFVLNVLDSETFNVTKQHWILVSGRLLTFEVFMSSTGNDDESNIIVVLSVEVAHRTELIWHKLSGENFQKFWSWPIQVRVERLLHFRYNNDNRLMTIIQTSNYSGSSHSYIDIWGFSISGNLSDFWLSQRLPRSDVLDVKICPAYSGIMVALQVQDNIFIYDYTSDNSREAYFEESPGVKSVGLMNFVCFQSGHVLYLATSGPNAAILDYFEEEFQFHLAISEILKEEIVWVETIPVDTYRDEVLVLVQMKNHSIAGLVWQDNTFKSIPLPSFDATGLHLSQITVIPKVGFVYKDRIMRIQTDFKELQSPAYEETEKMLRRKDDLEEVLRKQNLVFELTKTRLMNSHLMISPITGRWQIANFTSQYAIIEQGIPIKTISLGQNSFTQADFEANLIEPMSTIQQFNRQIDLIYSNVNNAVSLNCTHVKFPGVLHILGDLTVNKLTVDHLSSETVNNQSIAEIFADPFGDSNDRIIEGQKFFPSINASTVTVISINGIPIEDLVFDENEISYDEIDLANLTTLVIDGNLNFSHINGHDWEDIVNNAVSKTESLVIPGETIINGRVSATYATINYLNHLRYPTDYVLRRNTDAVFMPSTKKFKTLTAGSLRNLLTINESPVDEFILLHEDRRLSKTITFEHLEITGHFQIDGNITGGPEIQNSTPLINETRTLMTPANFARLNVVGRIQVNEKINQKTWPMFEDLVDRNEETVEIKGKKVLAGHVIVRPTVNITSGKINGHHLNEFLTTNTSQELPNLERIEANVTFGKLTRGDLLNLEPIFSECLKKVMTFKVPPIVDQLILEKLHGNVSREDFMKRLNNTSVVYERLATRELHVSRLSSENINGVKSEVFASRLISKTKPQNLSGNFEIGNLDAGMLRAETLDGRTIADLENERKTLDDLYEMIVNGSVTIDTLTVTELISSERVNDYELRSIYDPKTMGTVVLHENASISELNVAGLFNGQNLSKIVDDAVLKTDRNIAVKGSKTMTKIVCEILNVASWNHHPAESFLNRDDHQELTGPVVVKGKTEIEQTLDNKRKIGNVTLEHIQKQFGSVGTNKFVLNGNFKFPEDVDIDNLLMKGFIQGVNFTDLQKTFVFLDSENISITGSKVFKDSVKFNNLTINDHLNENDLQKFYGNVIFLDGRSPVKGKLRGEDIIIRGDVIVKEKIEVNTMAGVDVNELMESAIYLNRPVHIPGTTTFKDVVFASNIKLEKLNDILMDNLFPLHKDKVIANLHCTNISVDAIKIEGTVNNEKLENIYRDSFQLTGHQNITGNFTFLEDVNIRRDFDAPLLNGINPRRCESLEDNEPFEGDLVFENEVILNGSLRVLGLYNTIDPLTWQALAVTTKCSMPQVVSGVWTINGDVHLKGPVVGTGLLNGTNLQQMIDDLRERDNLLDSIIKDKEQDLQSICNDLELLKDSVNSQIFKLKFFDYAQVLEFDGNILSAHYFEAYDSDCLFVSLEDCTLMGFVFDGDEFVKGPAISDFGLIEDWISLNYKGAKYFVTMGRSGCGKSPGNLWRLTDEEMVHVMDLGGVEDASNIGDYEFVVLVGGRVLHYSLERIHEGSRDPLASYSLKNKVMSFVNRDNAENRDVVLLNRELAVHVDLMSGAVTTTDNVFGAKNISSYRFGPLRRELFLYYDEAISDNYIFIADYEDSSSRVVQTVDAYRPSSMNVMSFGGGVEDLLMYIEGCQINIHEYRGVEGFVYRETLHIEAEKLMTIGLRRNPLLEKANCLGVITRNRLEILEAIMYGQRISEKTSFPCEN